MMHTDVATTPVQEYDKETRERVFQYVLQLADTSLILAHRLSEWCGHGPVLEQDMAMSNTALDMRRNKKPLPVRC